MLSSKTIGYIPEKLAKEQVFLYSWDYTINHKEHEDENQK